MRIKLTIIFSLISFLLIGYKIIQDNYGLHHPYGSLSEGQSVYGLELQSSGAESSRNLKFNLIENVFRPTITLLNDSPEDISFDLITLVDYSQVPVQAFNKKNEIVTTTVDRRSEKKVEISVPNIREGSHDFIIIAILHNKNVDSQILSYRTNISVKSSKESPSKIVNYIKPSLTSKDIEKGELDSIKFNLPSNQSGQGVVSIKKAQVSQFVLLSFINDQIMNTTYYNVEQEGYYNVPITFGKKISHPSNIFFVLVNNPFVDLESTHLSKRITTSNITSIQ